MTYNKNSSRDKFTPTKNGCLRIDFILLKDDMKQKFCCKITALLDDKKRHFKISDIKFCFRFIHHSVRLDDDIVLFARSQESAQG